MEKEFSKLLCFMIEAVMGGKDGLIAGEESPVWERNERFSQKGLSFGYKTRNVYNTELNLKHSSVARCVRLLNLPAHSSAFIKLLSQLIGSDIAGQ